MTDTPFKAGETYRTRDGREARVYAVDHCPAYPIVGAVRDYGEWQIAQWTVAGLTRGDKGIANSDLIPPAPTPPADDLAAARAEIERLRSVLQDIAEERPYRKGYDQTDVDYEPAFTGTEAMNLARAALLPSPPDAKAADCRRCQGSGAEPPHEDVECKECGGTGRRSAKPAPERERLKGWVNVYKAGFSGAVHTEKGDADELAAQRQQNDRLACIDLSQHFVGEGLEP